MSSLLQLWVNQGFNGQHTKMSILEDGLLTKELGEIMLYKTTGGPHRNYVATN